MFNKKKITAVLSIFVLFFCLFSYQNANAFGPQQTEEDLLGLEYGQYTGLGNEDVRFTVARIINVALGLLGIIMVVILVYAGFLWMTAAGNDEQVGKAKKMIMAAVIGLAIILSAYAISNFVVRQLYKATT
ncbi:MAG: hypothetical protein GF349_02535, partial [Candidatus Magasanikbacteria bacterium]|nr:hypothetical protein [Candidatus Magasanikbacteria bacterium]